MYRRHVTRTIVVATVLFAVLGVAATPVVVAAPTPNVGTDFYRPPVPLPVGEPVTFSGPRRPSML